MASKRTKFIKKRLLGILAIVVMVVSLFAAAVFLARNEQVRLKEFAKECECDQYNSCGTGYKCSSTTCGSCVKTSTPAPTGGGSGGGSTPKPGGGSCIKNGKCLQPGTRCCSGYYVSDFGTDKACSTGNVCAAKSR